MSWTLVQGNTGAIVPTNSSAVSKTFGSSVAIGHLVTWVCGFYYPSGAAVTFTATDSFSNTWVTVLTQILNGSNYHLQIACGYSVITNAGALDVTVTITGSLPDAALALSLQDWSVGAGASIVVGNHASGSGSSTSPSTGAITFSGAGNWLLAGGVDSSNASNTWTPGTGFNADYAVSSQAPSFLSLYQANLTNSSSPLAVTASGANVNWCMAGMSFQEVLASGFTPWIYGDQIEDFYG